MSGSWRHPERKLGERKVGNTTLKLFPNHLSSHLGSEIPQNTHDAAKLDPGLGRIAPNLRFTFKTIPLEKLSELGIEEIHGHLLSCNVADIPRPPSLEGGVRVLNFEDDGRGLDGPFQDDLNQENPSSAQRYFFETGTENHGKSGSDNGRHGLGSSIGPLTSRLRVSFSTTTRDDGIRLAMGRASMTPRVHDGVAHSAESTFGVDVGEGIGPLTGEMADKVHLCLGFDRNPDATGLSVSVVEPLEEVSFHTLLAGVLSYQFYQIMNGDISITIVDEDKDLSVVLSKDTLPDVIDSALFADCKREVNGCSGDFRSLEYLKEAILFCGEVADADGADVSARLSMDGHLDVEDRPSVCEDWVAGKIVRADVGMPVSRRGEDPCLEVASVFLKKLAEGRRGFDILVRDRIVILRKSRVHGRVSVTRVSDNRLAELLGDSENASHQEFVPKLATSRGWVHAARTISHFKRLAGDLDRHLTGKEDVEDITSLARYFPAPVQGSQTDSNTVNSNPDSASTGTAGLPLPESLNMDSLPICETLLSPPAVLISMNPEQRSVFSRGVPVDIVVSVSVNTEGAKRGNHVGFLASGGRFSLTSGSVDCEFTDRQRDEYRAEDIDGEFELRLEGFDMGRDFNVNVEAVMRDAARGQDV